MADGRVYVNTAVFYNDYKDLQRAGFEPRSHRWELAVYARNVGNQAYITGAMAPNVGFPASSGRPGEPRQWGTQFTVRR